MCCDVPTRVAPRCSVLAQHRLAHQPSAITIRTSINNHTAATRTPQPSTITQQPSTNNQKQIPINQQQIKNQQWTTCQQATAKNQQANTNARLHSLTNLKRYLIYMSVLLTCFYAIADCQTRIYFNLMYKTINEQVQSR